jgi:thiol-disulfide isomerase/thioredoxin
MISLVHGRLAYAIALLFLAGAGCSQPGIGAESAEDAVKAECTKAGEEAVCAQDGAAAACGAMVAGCPAATASAELPRIIAVKFHADWCGYCKAMGQVFEELQAKFDTQPVLYVTLDLTREFDRGQAKYLAHAMGLADIWAEHGGKTGFILLIDGKTRAVIARLTHQQTLAEMGAALLDAVESAPGCQMKCTGG